MISFIEFLNESPLPDDWDKKVFDINKTSYKQKIKYAVSRALKIGKGSSRTAFTIDYQNRPTALKIAHNDKGIAQNVVEIKIAKENKKNVLIIPIIDYDKENKLPVWIHFEKAEKASELKLKKLLKTSLEDLIYYSKYIIENKNAEQYLKNNNIIFKSDEDKQTFINFSFNLIDLIKKYNLIYVDLNDIKNWGIFNNTPVIIDFGYDEYVEANYYN
jgi:predicted Ser/Thr protein kinase